jgi:hypothetical protein
MLLRSYGFDGTDAGFGGGSAGLASAPPDRTSVFGAAERAW